MLVTILDTKLTISHKVCHIETERQRDRERKRKKETERGPTTSNKYDGHNVSLNVSFTLRTVSQNISNTLQKC